MNERLRKVRDLIGISQKEFSEKINIGQSTLAMLENGQRTLKDIHISQICNNFKVDEDWLRYGKGEMFIKNDSTILSNLIDEYDLDSLDKKIVKGYINLTSDQRDVIKTYVSSLVNDINDENAAAKDEEDEIKEELESYRLELEAEKKGTTSPVSENGENIG